MRNILLLLSICVVLTLCAVSCKKEKSNQVYYGYCEQASFILVYNGRKDTLYYVSVPTEAINEWGWRQGFEFYTDSFRNFVGLEETGLILTSNEAFITVKSILDSLSLSSDPENLRNPESKDISDGSATRRLRTLVDMSAEFRNPSVSEKIRIICGLDLSPLFAVLGKDSTKTIVLDARSVFTDDLDFSQEYFRRWFTQIL